MCATTETGTTAIVERNMSELEASLGTLGLQEYSKPLVSRGFKTWDDVVKISEDSLADIGFKLGHRRKLQREIASYEGKPYTQPLIRAPIDPNLDEDRHPSQLSPEADTMEIPKLMRPKRKYRPRRPKDPHAPQRPKSDYVLFANFLRESPRVSELTFVEISRLVGKQWQSLLPHERAMWSSFAAQQKNKYEIELLAYKRTESYKRYQGLLQARKADRLEAHQKIVGGSQNQIEHGLLINEVSKPEDLNVVLSKSSPRDSTTTMSASDEQEHILLPEGAAACTQDTDSLKHEPSESEQDFFQRNYSSDDLEMEFSLYGESPTATSFDRDDTMSYQPMPASDHGREPVPLNMVNAPQRARSFHIEALNPFHLVEWTSTWPYMERFLQAVNSQYYLINHDEIVGQFNQAMARSVRLPNHTMCALCICISIGCQLHHASSEEMAIMWYENGRRYLDSDDWGWSLNVMRAMALISVFHRNERPTTARHYLGMASGPLPKRLLMGADTAVRIGEANHLPVMISSELLLEDTPCREWVLVWGTIRGMASGR